MEIETAAQRITLTQQYYIGQEEVTVRAELHDHLQPNDPDYSLYDVQPGIVAVPATTKLPSGDVVPVMQVGTLVITAIEVVQWGTDPAHTVRIFPNNGTSFQHSVLRIHDEQTGDTGWFSSGTVWWGDGTSSAVDFTEANGYSHTYSAAGTYDVRLALHLNPGPFNPDFICAGSPAATRRFVVT